MVMGSLNAANWSLDSSYGPNRGPLASASHDLALFYGDPLNGGVELSGGGYARVTIPAASWPNAATTGNMKRVTVNLPAPSADWDPATHFVLIGTDGTWWDVCRFSSPLRVTVAGPVPPIDVVVFYN